MIGEELGCVTEQHAQPTPDELVVAHRCESVEPEEPSEADLALRVGRSGGVSLSEQCHCGVAQLARIVEQIEALKHVDQFGRCVPWDASESDALSDGPGNLGLVQRCDWELRNLGLPPIRCVARFDGDLLGAFFGKGLRDGPNPNERNATMSVWAVRSTIDFPSYNASY